VKEIHGCASGLERETLIGSVTSRLAQPVGEAIAASCRGHSKHQMHDVEDDWTNLPIDPPYSAQVTAESKALTGYSR
jgi:hypothetical protein